MAEVVFIAGLVDHIASDAIRLLGGDTRAQEFDRRFLRSQDDFMNLFDLRAGPADDEGARQIAAIAIISRALVK